MLSIRDTRIKWVNYDLKETELKIADQWLENDIFIKHIGIPNPARWYNKH